MSGQSATEGYRPPRRDMYSRRGSGIPPTGLFGPRGPVDPGHSVSESTVDPYRSRSLGAAQENWASYNRAVIWGTGIVCLLSLVIWAVVEAVHP